MLCLWAIVAGGVLTPFPSLAASAYPVVVSPAMTSYNGQLFGYQICPIEDYNNADPAAVLANHKKYGLVKRFVYCVKGLVLPAAYKIMNEYSNTYFYGPIAAACTLAVALWGFLLVTGKQSATARDAFVVALKIGSVFFFTYVLGQSSIWPQGLFPVLVEVVDELGGIVTAYIGYSSNMKCAQAYAVTDIWGRVDCALNALIGGIFNPSMLLAGLLGFLVCAFVSGAFGLFIALAGFGIIALLLQAVLRATYIAATAYVALAVMALISPIFITMILFGTTRGYFEKWVKLLISFVLQPIFLLAYLAMMLAAFDTVVYDGKYSIYRAIVPANDIGYYPAPLASYPPRNPQTNPDGEFLIGQWLWDEGLYRQASGSTIGVNANPRVANAVQATNIGIGGAVAGEDQPSASYRREDAAGIMMNALDNFQPRNMFKVNIPIAQITWQYLSLLHLCTTPGCNAVSKRDDICRNYCSTPPPSPAMCNPYDRAQCTESEEDAFKSRIYSIKVNFLVQLLLALLIAFVTLYLFYLMLDRLPFIGSGMSGGDKHESMSFGGMKMPGNKLFDKMKAGMGKLAGGGGAS